VFAVLYRHETVPLVRHAGELLTITVLGGACFGLPTTLVSERERGVWRQLRLAPVPTGSLVAATVASRYVILISAGVLQLALAMSIGMPVPAHPADLWVAFTSAAFAFLGIGLVLAMMADTVPAVQALGQCVFLPMLIIGGVAVPLGSLPEWARRVSAFLPGRYAVDALQASVTGEGLASAQTAVPALIVMGAASCVAAAKVFRWDPRQRFATTRGKGWLAVAGGAWIAVGLWGQQQTATTQAAPSSPPVVEEAAIVPVPAVPGPEDVVPERPRARSQSWRAVTQADIDRGVSYSALPPDSGVVAPIAGGEEPPDTEVIKQLVRLRRGLAEWPPAKVADPVQRVRNYLYVAAVPDVFQIPLERHAPMLVFDRLKEEFPESDLVRLLYWVARHPSDGDDDALGQLHTLGLGTGPSDVEQTRERVTFYALKLLGRLTGRIADS
jgi:ABC-2 type transport system permease protein